MDGARIEASRVGGNGDVFEDDPRIRMFDVAFDQECQLLTFGDGVKRCAPGIRRPDFEGVTSFAVYLDAACTQVRGLGSVEHDSFLAGEWVGKTFAISQVLRGGLVSQQQGEYFEKRDGACVANSTGNGALYDIVDAIDTDELPAFSLVTLESTSLVGSQALVGDDGTQLFTGFYDHALDTKCSTQSGVDGDRCMPVDSRETEGWFADAACTQPAVPVGERTTRFAHDVDDEWCVTSFELGAATMMPVYHRDGAACVPDGMGMYQVGTKLESPVIDYTVGDEPGRIVQLSAARVPLGLYDTEQQVTCSPRFERWSGHDRCVPEISAGTTTELFADASCTQPTEVVRGVSTRCFPMGRFASRDQDSYAVIGEPVDVFTLIDDRCVPYVSPDGEQIRAIGDIVPRDAFVPATLVHAP